MSAPNDEAESVDQFLARIASLSRKNDDQDAHRARRMEEDMLRARKERQARRAERARSISPVKTGPAGPALPNPRVGASPRERSIEPPVTLTPRSQTQTPSRTGPSPQLPASEPFSSSPPFEAARPLPQPPSPEHHSSPSFPATSATPLSRSGTLSWQQRPTSRGFGSVRGRPLAGSRSPVRTRPESPKLPSSDRDEPELSRNDIAASLSSRDPAWFRQTEDRGLKSGAYRKTSNQELFNDTPSHKGLRLPGLSSDVRNSYSSRTDHIEHQSPPPAEEAVHPPEARVLRSSAEPIRKQSTERPVPLPPVGGSSLTDANVSKPADAHDAAEAESVLARSGSILGAGRPPSPTKGLGGFVQSAMMRRSDSVSKRWSVQANSGLKRGDSIASNKPVFSPPAAPTGSLGHARTLSRDPRGPRGPRDGTSSPLSGSRPSSSHDQSQLHQSFSDLKRPASEISSPPAELSDKTAHVVPNDRPSTPPSTEPSLSRSPSKTLDPRRWSPTKASWLESALSKPELPRPNTAKPEPPSWKLDMQRSKSSKELQESPKRPTSTFDSVTTGGLLRSPPPGMEARLPPSFGDTLSKQTRSTENSLPEEDRHNSEDFTAKSDKSIAATLRDEPEMPSKAAQHEDQGEKIQQQNPASSQSTVNKPQSPPGTRPKPDFRSSQDKPPIALTFKPQTPPKTDFRATLKSRQPGDTSSKDNEPEFKAVFGKLKRTQIQNYVAPDVLKDNISRGKAALNTTGGPQQTKRVDEFKESILAKKDAMKQGIGSMHKKDEPSHQEKPTADVPEALARRKTLSKAKPTADIETSNPPIIQRPVAEKPAKQVANLAVRRQEAKLVAEPSPVPADSTVKTDSVVEVPQRAAALTTVTEKPAAAFRPSVTSPPNEVPPVAGVQHTIPRQAPAVVSRPSLPFTAASKQPQRSPSPTKDISGKLAARLNPSLAGLIGRVHSPKLQEESITLRPSPLDDSGTSQTVAPESVAEDTSALQHMTKARARGPKRRAPNADAKDNSQEPAASAAPKPTIAKAAISKAVKPIPTQTTITANLRPSPNESAAAPLPKGSAVKLEDRRPAPHGSEKSGAIEPHVSRTPSESSPGPKIRPFVVSKSPELRKVSNKAADIEHKEERPLPKPPTAGKGFDIATDGTSQDAPIASTSTPSQEVSHQQVVRPLPLTPSKSKLNSPSKPMVSPLADLPAGKAKSKPAGLGLNLKNDARKRVTAAVLTPPSDTDLAVPALKSKRVGRERNAMSASDIVRAYFGTVPRSADRGEFDTEAFLGDQATELPRIKTLSKLIWEVHGDGKRSTLPPGQDHILFEGCMYLCVHTFETDKASKSIEAYLWAGDSVPDAAIEDAQLFCRKVARENSAKLEIVKQGKETSKFFSALGGIVIIRRTKSSALYMLCGRRHLGHVAFDEVDMSAARLCSGFPFLISAKFGKLYLWKGRGSGVDEISAAKLISMDLSLTGEIEEVSESAEPASFWETFSDKRSFQSSEVWSVRSVDQQKGFPCRLYRVEPERPKSSGGFWGLRASSPPKPSTKVALQEIDPYTQKDLDRASVHVLDTYATIYVIPPSSATPKPTEFVSALQIVQEMSVLAPSVQDRALLPASEVVFGEPPRGFQAAFRKWTPGLNVDTSKESACVEVAEVLRVLD